MSKIIRGPKTLLESLDELIETYHLLKHPFYKAWTEGKLSSEELGLYAEQYYQHVRAFPENLKQLASRTNGDLNLKSIVDENLEEELEPSAPHPLLWRQFAHAIGVTDTSLDDAHPLPGVAALLDRFDEAAARSPMAEAVAAFYVYEAQVPEIAAQKIDGLRRFYNMTEPGALAYFAVHEEADVRHRAAWRGWLAEQKNVNTVEVLNCAERTLKALWGGLDAVYPQGCISKN